MLVYDCPRCGAQKITFDILSSICVYEHADAWKKKHEIFGYCRSCKKSSVFLVKPNKNLQFESLIKHQSSLNEHVDVIEVVISGLLNPKSVPEHLPEQVEIPFREAAMCQAIQAWNAAGCMFRTSIDIATKELLQKLQDKTPPKEAKDNLAKRIEWLLDEGHITKKLEELSTCIRNDGNDAAHEANLGKEVVEDMTIFARLLLEEIYTTPKRIELATDRQKNRGQSKEKVSKV